MKMMKTDILRNLGYAFPLKFGRQQRISGHFDQLTFADPNYIPAIAKPRIRKHIITKPGRQHNLVVLQPASEAKKNLASYKTKRKKNGGMSCSTPSSGAVPPQTLDPA
jgi:hypothetical protein